MKPPVVRAVVRAFAFGWFGAATLGFCNCSTAGAPSSVKRPAQSATASDYSLTQRSASQPERGNAAFTEAPMAVVGRCDVELCEGDLSTAAIAELRARAIKSRDCYEKELKENNQLEGKLLVRLRLAYGREPCAIEIEPGNMTVSEAFAKCITDLLRQTTARPNSGCIDLALPLAFVRQEVEATPDAGSPEPTSGKK